MERDDIWKRDYKKIGYLRMPKFKRAEEAVEQVTEMEKEWSKG